MKYIRALVFLLLVGNLRAGGTSLRRSPPHIQQYMRINASVYNDGHWCRNAAAYVAVAAMDAGDDFRVPRYWVQEDKKAGHTFPVVLHRGSWYAIDSVYDQEKQAFVPFSRKFRDYRPVRDMSRYADFSERPLLEYNGDATASRLEFWFNEPDLAEEFANTVAKFRKKIVIGERALRLMTKQFPGLWDSYVGFLRKHRLALSNKRRSEPEKQED